jgi:hypothetical protein
MSASERAEMVPVSGRAKVFFAPVQRDQDVPTIFDPSAGFDPTAPAVPWVDLGWVENVKRSAATKMGAVRTGPKGQMRAQFRLQTDARLSLDFREWGKLQMALASGSQNLNVVAGDGTQPECSGGHAIAAIVLGAGSTAQELMLDSASLAKFAVGDLVVVDVDYATQTGYVGSGVSGAFVPNSAAVHDPDYVRRVSYNVGRVVQVTANSVVLEQALIGGVPLPSAKVQKVVAFLDREGASFFQEWSALIVLPKKAGGSVCFYYPRLQSSAPAGETMHAIGDDVNSTALHAEFAAMAVTDNADGEQVVCYRIYFPAKNALSY